MLPEAKQYYSRVKEAHEDLIRIRIEVKEKAEQLNSMEEFADLAYALEMSGKMIDDLEKENRLLNELMQRKACMLWVTRSLDGSNIKTEYTNAKPVMKEIATLPRRHKDPQAYNELMKFLGVPAELLEGDKPPVGMDWKGMVDMLSDRKAKGLPLPPGIDPDKTYPLYELHMMRRKDVDE
jgi:hypothetical protein